MAREISIRLSVEDADRVKAVLQSVGATGEQAFVAFERGASRGAQSFARLERSLDPLLAAQARLAAAQAGITRALETGLTTQERANQLQEMARQQYLRLQQGMAQATAGAVQLNQAVGITSNQMRQLAPQLNDIATQLLMGQSPFMIMAAQGGQVTQVFGGIRPTLAALAGAIPPVAVAGAALAGSFALGVARAAELGQEARQLSVALRGTGRDAEASTAQLQGYIDTLKRAGTGGAEARGMIAGLARTQGLRGSDIGRVTSLAPDLAAALGTELPQAADLLAKAFGGTYEGVRRLDDALNALTANERASIRTMLEHGDRAGAMKAQFLALERQLKGLNEEALSPAERAWRGLKNSFGDFIDAVAASVPAQITLRGLGATLSGIASVVRSTPSVPATPQETLDDQLAQAEERLARLRAETARYRDRTAPATVPGFGFGAPVEFEAQLQAQLTELRSRRAALPTPAAPSSALSESQTTAELQRQQKALDELTRSHAEQQRVLAAGLPDRVRVRAEIQAEREAAERGLTGAQAEELRRRRVAEALAAEVDARSQEVQAINRQIEASLREAQAGEEGRAALLRSAAAAQAHEEAATRTGVAEAALARAILNRTAASEAARFAPQLLQLREQAEAAERLATVQAQGPRAAHLAELEEKARGLTAALRAAAEATTDPAVRAALQRQIDLTGELVRQTDAEVQRRQALAALYQQDQALEVLRAEGQLVGANLQQRERELAVLRERQRILAAGQDPNSAENQRRLALAAQIADETQALRRQQEAWSELSNVGVQAFDRIGTAITQALANGQLSTIRFGNIVKATISEVVQYFAKMALVNPVLNAVFGANRPTVSDLAGIVGRVFGGGGGGGAWAGGAGVSEPMLLAYQNHYSATNAAIAASGTFGPATPDAVQLQGGLPMGMSVLSPAPLSAGGGGSNLLGSVSSLAGLGHSLSGGSLFSGLGSSLGLTGPGGLLNTTVIGMNPAQYGVAAVADGGFGAVAATPGTTLGGLLGGAAAGFGAGMLTSSIVGGIRGTADPTGGMIGAGGGALAGAIIGSIIPGIGTLIGGLIGGALGGGGGALFGPTKKGMASRSGGDVFYGLVDGQLTITAARGKRWDQVGAVAQVQDQLDAINKAVTERNLTYAESGVRGAVGFGQASGSPRELQSAAIVAALRSPIADVQAALDTLARDAADVEKALSSVDWVNQIYLPLTQSNTAAAKFQRELDDLNTKFGQAISKAGELGLSETKLTAARDRQLQAATDRRDLVGLQQVQRQQGTLTAFLDSLTLSRASPEARLQLAQAAFGSALGAARNADITTADLQAVTRTASSLLSASQAYYATGGGAAELERFVVSSIQNLGAQLQLPAFGGELEASLSAAVNPLKDELQLLRDEVTALREELRTSRLRLAA